MLATVSAELATVELMTTEDGALIDYTETFTIGPYTLAPQPWSPLGVLQWLPWDNATDPVVDTANLTFTPAEYDLAVLYAQAWLQYVALYCPLG